MFFHLSYFIIIISVVDGINNVVNTESSQSPLEVTVLFENFRLLHVDELPSTMSLALSLCVYWSERLPNKPVQQHTPELNFDKANTLQLLGPFCQIALWTAVAYCTLPATSHPLIVRRISYFVALSMIVSLMGYFAPFMTLSLRCVPHHAHPCPIDFPTPNELLSLDSERARYSSVLDSARHDSSPSQRNVNADLCMAQVRYTLSAVNEFLSITASAKWHRRQWMQGFARIQMLLLIFFQAVNLVLFLILSSN